jgi:hypothetical protein
MGDSRGEHASSFARICYDPVGDELYVANGDTVVVYREGLETYRFTAAPEIGQFGGLAVLENGEILALSTAGELFRLSYRGKLLGRVPITRVPGSVGGIRPDRIQLVKGRVYLSDSSEMKVIVVNDKGEFLVAYDLAALILEGKPKTEDYQLNGFGVDDDGNLLFTIAPLFKAYVVSRRGEVKSFGTAGSREGRFNVAGAIARDESGIIYVADALRCVVNMYDKDFQYLGEIGGRGYGPGQLIVPSSIVIANHWLFVAQGGDRGVTAFRVF